MTSNSTSIKEIKKYKDLLDLVQFPEDIFYPKENFTQATPDSKNKGVIVDGVRLPTQNAIFVNNNLLTDSWVHLRPALATSAEALFILLGFPKERLRKSLFSINKYFKSFYFHSRKQFKCLINTRKLIVAITKEKRKEALEILFIE